MIVSRPLSGAGTPLRATAVCAPTDAVGDLVRAVGPLTGMDYTVSKVDMLVAGAKAASAVIVAKINSTRCVIQFEGEVRDVFTGLDAASTYFVGSDSKPSSTPPQAPLGGFSYLQVIGVALASNVLYFRPEADMKVRVG